MNESITTLSIFRFKGFSAKLWALSQMQLGYEKLKGTPGMQFIKLLGSGGESGFSWKPEWGKYALLAVWENETYADSFLMSNTLLQNYVMRSFEHVTVVLACRSVHGHWSGECPFKPTEREITRSESDINGPMAVITRATIKPRYLWRFWRRVAPIARSLQNYPERRLSVGIGEWPIVQQATFSMWENQESMVDFAYKNPVHAAVVKKNREEGWFDEELFARFSIQRIQGNWKSDDLSGLAE